MMSAIPLPFQSTRPRGARRMTTSSRLRSSCVSIHAPAWGATRLCGYQNQFLRVSIHAPAWGATLSSAELGKSLSEFQSTRPRGARPCVGERYDWCLSVSIHAPAWGATAHRSTIAATNVMFQSTRPRGARHCTIYRTPGQGGGGFNPRARVGRDRTIEVTLPRLTLRFQSTRPRGARLYAIAFYLLLQTVSIHAPAWGATILAALY